MTAYTKQTWLEGQGGGTPLSPARLNHLEDGVEQAAGDATTALSQLTSLTPASFGLDQVNNTSDVNKPVSTAQAAAIALKAPKLPGTFTDSGGTGSPEGVVTATIGSTWRRSDGGAATSLYVKESGSGNTGWVAIPTSGGGGSYQPLDSDLTAIAGLAPSVNDVLQYKGSAWANRTIAQLKTDLAYTATDVGLGSVNNTADSAKPVSTAQQTALDLKQNKVVWSVKGTDQTLSANSVTLQNVTGLSLAVAASKVYRVQFTVIYDAGPTPDLKVGLTFPAGCTGTWFGSPSRNTADVNLNLIVADISATISTGGVASGTVLAATFTVVLHVSTTAGTLQVQAAQDVSNATAPIVKTDSYIEANERG